MQICRLCEINQPLSNYQFRKDTSKYRTECKQCLSKKNKQYRKDIKNGKIIPNKSIIVNNKITCNKCNVIKTLDKYSQYKNRTYKNECKKCAQNRINKYRRENIEYKKRYNKYQRDRRNIDINYLLEGRFRARINKLLITTNNGEKFFQTKTLLGCSKNTFKDHLEKLFYGDMSFEKRNFVLDHIVPCSWFDLSNPIHQKICFNYKNIQPLTREDNSIKCDKIWINFDLTKNPYI